MSPSATNEQDYIFAKIILLYFRHYCANKSPKELKRSIETIKSFAKDSQKNRVAAYRRGWNNATKNFLSVVNKILERMEERPKQTPSSDKELLSRPQKHARETDVFASTPIPRNGPCEMKNLLEDARTKRTDSKQSTDK